MSAYPSERKASIRLLCLIVFLGHLAVASGTIFGLDGSKRVEVAENLIDHGRVDIQPTEFSPLGRDGKQYTQYAIGPSLVTIPFYLAGRTLARFVPARGAEVVEFSEAMVNLVATVLTVGCLALFAIELGFHLRTAVIIGLLYAFGTMAWQQSKDSFEHPQVALYFTVLFYLLHRFARLRQRRLLLAAGLSLGAAVLTRYTTVLVGTGVVAFLSALAMRSGSQRPVRDAVVWSALVALPAVPFLVFDLWFNAMRFGSMLETGQQQLFGNLLSTATVLSGLWGLTLSLSEGLFVFVPVLWLGVWAVPRFAQRHWSLAIAVLVTASAHLLFYAMTKPVLRVGGWAWGPRFFVDVMPLLVLMCAPVFERAAWAGAPRRWLNVAVPLMVVLSVVIQVESVLVNSNRNLVKQATGLEGHSYASRAISNSMIYMQAESIVQIARGLWRGQRPDAGARRINYREADAAMLLDRSLTYGTFQIWWVYALHLGVAKGWVLSYLCGTLLMIALSARVLRQRLTRDARSRVTPPPVCPCTSRSSIPT